LSNLANQTSSGTGLYETPNARYVEPYGERKYTKENECMPLPESPLGC
jgi:hypothetical protein